MVSKDVSGEAVMAIEWTFFVLAYILVGLRLGVRLAHKQQSRLIISDIFLVISAVVCLGLIICDTVTYKLGGMSGASQLIGEPSAKEKAQEVLLAKISFASNYFFDTGMYFPKATILALYFTVFPITMPRLRLMLYIVTGYTLLCGISTCGLDTFYCPNVSDNWSTEEGSCSSFESYSVLRADWAMDFTSDIFIFALPLPILRHLTLRRTQFYGLILTFALGFLTIVVSAGRFISIEIGNSWNAAYIWSMIQLTVAIIVVSLPALKTLVRRWNMSGNRSRLGTGSRTTSGYTGQNGTRILNEISRSLPDDMGSEVELNGVAGNRDAIFKKNEVIVDSRPLGEEERSSSDIEA